MEDKPKELSDVGFEDDIKEQKKLETTYDIIKTQGFVRNLVITPRAEGDPMYKFQIRFIDESDNLQEPDDWYSGFKNPPGKEGDYLVFTYKKKGIYNNVQDLIERMDTHEEANESDVEKLEDVNKEMVEPEMDSDLEGDNARVQLPTEGLSEPYKALLLNGTIHLCTKRGTLTHEDVVSQYCRFLKLIDS